MRKRFPIYQHVLRLYPEAYRKRYGSQMVQTLADMLDDQPSKLGRTEVWLRAGWDLSLSIAYQNALMLGDSLMHNMPKYIKRNAMISAALLVPFAIAITANTADKLIYHRYLYQSWLWSLPMLRIWVLWLPAAAFLVALISFLHYAATDKHGYSVIRRLADLSVTWPIVLTGLIGLSILCMLRFHDSTHCLLQNPLASVTHVQQTLQCINRS